MAVLTQEGPSVWAPPVGPLQLKSWALWEMWEPRLKQQELLTVHLSARCFGIWWPALAGHGPPSAHRGAGSKSWDVKRVCDEETRRYLISGSG